MAGIRLNEPSTPGAWRVLAKTRLGAAGNFSFTGINSGFRAFMLIYSGAKTGAGVASLINLNNDATGTYFFNREGFENGAGNGAAYAAQTAFSIENATGTNCTGVVVITNNGTGDYPQITATGGTEGGTCICTGYWSSVVEISRIDLAQNGNTFAAGTSCILLAMK